MTRSEQVAGERAQLDFALEKLGIEPTSIKKPDPPDFIIEVDGRVIAVEVVQARDEEAARASGAITRLKSGLRTSLDRLGLNVYAHLSLTQGCAELLHQYPAKLKEHVNGLTELCVAFAENGLTDRKFGAGQLKRHGAGWINWVRVSKNDKPFVTWGTGGPGQRRRVIQEAIDRKARKLPAYRKAAPEVWLLVVAGTGRGASIDQHEATGVFVSPFDRTIFVECFEKVVIELETRPPAQAS